MYRIELTPKAEEELVALGKSGDKASVKKVYLVLSDLQSERFEYQHL